MRRTHSHRFVLQIKLSNQLPVISWINNLATNEELYLGMCSVGFDPVQDATPDWANSVISVRPYIQVIHLTPLVGEADDQCDMLPTKSSAREMEQKKVQVAIF